MRASSSNEVTKLKMNYFNARYEMHAMSGGPEMGGSHNNLIGSERAMGRHATI